MTSTELLEKYGYQDKIVDMIALSRKVGFNVIIDKVNVMKEDLGSLLVWKEKNIRAITINGKQSKDYIRFVIAYLIAAYIENGNDEKFVARANSMEFIKEENECLLTFATDILLPDKLLSEKNINLENLKYEDLKSIKEEFCVPNKVLEKKIKKVGDD